MKKIQLTQEKHALVDDSDYEELNKFKWTAQKVGNGHKYYAVRMSSRSLNPESRQYSIKMHAHLLGTPKGMVSDHIDGDELNNQRQNLRVCTVSQNAMNCKAREGSKGGLKGVSLERGKWRAKICKDGIKRHIGLFNSKELAHAAYWAEAIKLHGNFAKV